MNIIKVKLSDIDQLVSLSQKTFLETFGEQNSQENMEKYLESGLSKQQLSSELNDQNSEFYFAEQDGKLMGYIKLNFDSSQTEVKSKNSVEIERIYIIKEHQGKKIGQLLLDFAIQKGKELALDFIWLGVWERNNGAIRFYEKNGFKAFDQHVFKLGEEEQVDIMMNLLLK